MSELGKLFKVWFVWLLLVLFCVFVCLLLLLFGGGCGFGVFGRGEGVVVNDFSTCPC